MIILSLLVTKEGLVDAGYNLSDVLGLLLAWGASFLAQRPTSKRYTYGLTRLNNLYFLRLSELQLVTSLKFVV